MCHVYTNDNDLGLLNFQVSLMEEHQWNLSELSQGSSLDEYIQSLQNLRTDLSAQLDDSVDKLLIKPLTEYQLLLIKVDSIIKKRNNKLLDYDRNQLSYDKMVNNPSRRNELSEEKKIIKVQLTIIILVRLICDLFIFIVARTGLESGYNGIRPLQQFAKARTASSPRSTISTPKTRNPNPFSIPKAFLFQKFGDILVSGVGVLDLGKDLEIFG